MKIMKRLFYILPALMLAVACEDMRLQKPEELGTDADEYIVDAEGGEALVNVYANMPGKAVLKDSPSWLRIANAEFEADATLSVNVSANTGAQRMASMVLSTAARLDTVLIKQKGAYNEYLDIVEASVVAYNGMGDTKAEISSNVDPKSVSFRKVYLDSEASDWITNVKLVDNHIVVSTKDNTDEKKVRRAIVEVQYTDGWNQTLGGSLRITQANSHNKVGNEISFEELRALAQDARTVIDDDYTLEGYVVSDRFCGNAGDNIQSTSTTIDTTVCHKTVYFESLDARYGVAIEFATVQDNILDYGSKAVINLEGATLVKENEPLRYSITGLTGSRVVSSQLVDPSEIPAKTKRMSELTDEDIYTRVTLTDCEWPIRKGSLTPINEGYTFLYSAQRVTKVPTLIRDIEGSSMYVLTNTTCPYRRDGSRMGYGSGTMSGVIVHETHRCFVDKDNPDEELCGNIGRYQIRHMSRADFNFADDFKDGFSDMICEWRYLVQGNEEDNSWNATYGEGTMNQSYPGAVQGVFNTHTYPVYDFSYLGPCGKKYTTNVNGFGIILEDGTDYGADYAFDPQKGNLPANNTIALAWMASNWWNTSRNAPEYWLINFSTKDITTDHLSMQLSMLNASQEAKSPIQWVAQWAESDTQSTTWHTISDFVVPDVVLYTVTQPWQSAGFKPMDIPLPLEMLGKENVYIRLIPANRLGNTTAGYLDTNYANGSTGSSSKANNAMNYFAIRYNK